MFTSLSVDRSSELRGGDGFSDSAVCVGVEVPEGTGRDREGQGGTEGGGCLLQDYWMPVNKHERGLRGALSRLV